MKALGLMCGVVHEGWRRLEGAALTQYYQEVAHSPPGPIWQCETCHYRTPECRLQDREEERTKPQEYAQTTMF